MNNDVKNISGYIAGRMIADFRAGKSIFERPASEKVLAAGLPFNLETGNKYKEPAALVLLMQNRDDPRWATMKQTNYNRTS
jgi:antirestriction protein ArdC